MKTILRLLGPATILLGLILCSSHADVHYVDAANPSPVSPYTSWATAATIIQLSVDAAEAGDEVVVTNGGYSGGERDGNRVIVYNNITLRSVNGPLVTSIVGSVGGVRCVSLGSNSILSGFTLSGGRSAYGGGISGGIAPRGVVTNCVITANQGDYGGGAMGGRLASCVLSNNEALNDGGGAYQAILENCLVSGNIARYGGGAYQSTLTRCEVQSNLARYYIGFGGGGGGAYSSTLRNCRVIANSTLGGVAGFDPYGVGGGGLYGGVAYDCLITGNLATLNSGGAAKGASLFGCTVISNSTAYGAAAFGSKLVNCIVYFNSCNCPSDGGNYQFCTLTNTLSQPFGGQDIFVNLAAADFRLRTNSPGINAGSNAYATNLNDLDDNPRIVGGTVDVGAYECQNPAMLNYFSWLQSFGLPTGNSEWYLDSDKDGMNNWQEWRSWTDPTNALSVFRMLTPLNTQTGLVVRWLSVPGKSYSVERSVNLSTNPAFNLFADGLIGQSDATSCLDTNASVANQTFHRVSVAGP